MVLQSFRLHVFNKVPIKPKSVEAYQMFISGLQAVRITFAANCAKDERDICNV